jgi:hypothetical protein
LCPALVSGAIAGCGLASVQDEAMAEQRASTNRMAREAELLRQVTERLHRQFPDYPHNRSTPPYTATTTPSSAAGSATSFRCWSSGQHDRSCPPAPTGAPDDWPATIASPDEDRAAATADTALPLGPKRHRALRNRRAAWGVLRCLRIPAGLPCHLAVAWPPRSDVNGRRLESPADGVPEATLLVPIGGRGNRVQAQDRRTDKTVEITGPCPFG